MSPLRSKINRFELDIVKKKKTHGPKFWGNVQAEEQERQALSRVRKAKRNQLPWTRLRRSSSLMKDETYGMAYNKRIPRFESEFLRKDRHTMTKPRLVYNYLDIKPGETAEQIFKKSTKKNLDRFDRRRGAKKKVESGQMSELERRLLKNKVKNCDFDFLGF